MKILAYFVVALTLLTSLPPVLLNIETNETLWRGTTIYIRENGSVDPPDAPIVRIDDNTYILTKNVEIVNGHGIVIQRDNAIFDGRGNVVQGSTYFTGIVLRGRRNVSLMNLTITGFRRGILLTNANNNFIANNNFVGGIVDLYFSNNNTIVCNAFNRSGLSLQGSYNNIVANNTVNGKPLVYLENISNIEITGEIGQLGQLIVVRGENITIKGLDMNDAFGINLINVIDSYIANNNISNTNFGISLIDSSRNRISSNNLSSMGIGLRLHSSNDNVIENNVISGTYGYGVFLYYSNGNNVFSNTISDTGTVGIYLHLSSDNAIKGNRVERVRRGDFSWFWRVNSAGIHIYYSDNNQIENNSISNIDLMGIVVDDSRNNIIVSNSLSDVGFAGVFLHTRHTNIQPRFTSNNTVAGNLFTRGGLLVWYSYNNTVIDNLINGKPVVYLENAANVEVVNASQVIVIRSENITIRGLNISDVAIGIHLHETSNTHVTNNTISGASWMGLYLQGSSNNIIEYNLISETNGCGLFISGSDNNIVKNNLILNTKKFIFPEDYIGEGLYHEWSSNNSIANNTILNTEGVGLHVGGFANFGNNTFSGNVIANNHIGLQLSWTRDNIFVCNDFLYNSIQVSIGDLVYYNTWDDGSRGNYWSDHTCVDADENGICDNLYVIRDPDNVDRYPSAYPYRSEVITVDVNILVTFVRATGGDVWYGLIGEDGSVNWRPLGGFVADAPSAVFHKDKIYVVVRSENGALWYGVINPKDWSFSGWISLQGLAGSSPSVVATDYGVIVAVRDFNNGIWVGLLDENGVNWVSIPGATVDSPAVAYIDGELHIVVRGLDGYTIWHGILELPSFDFKDWRQVNGLTNSAPGLLVVGDTLYLAVRDLGNGVALATYNKLVGWLGWIFIPGGLTDTQPNLAYFNGELTIIVKAYNDQSIWLARKDHCGYWNWVNIPGLTTHEPDLLGASYTYIRVVPKT